MKKILSILVATAFVLSLSAVASGCSSSKSSLNYKQAYAMGVIAGATYFNGNDSQKLSDAATDSVADSLVDSTTDTTSSESRPAAVEKDIPDMNKYVKMFEGYIINGESGIVSGNAEETEIGTVYGDYTITDKTLKQSISLPMLDGENAVYEMYYTEELKSASDVTAINDDDDDDDDETEEIAVLSGVVVLADGTFYPLSGQRSTESEALESETELEFIIKKDDSTYIKMVHSAEVEPGESETELEFSLYENNVLVSSTEIEFEEEDGEVEMSLEFNDDVASANHVVYKIKLVTENDKNVLKVSYKTSDETGNFKIEVVDDNYEYSYSNGYTETLER